MTKIEKLEKQSAAAVKAFTTAISEIENVVDAQLEEKTNINQRVVELREQDELIGASIIKNRNMIENLKKIFG